MTQSKTQAEVWDSISLDLISIQVGGKIVFINAAGAKMLGAALPGSLVGRSILDFVHPDYREIAAERMRQLADEGIVICPSEERWLRLDGTAIDVVVAAMPVLYESESAIQLIVRKNDECKPSWSARNWHAAVGSRRRRQ